MTTTTFRVLSRTYAVEAHWGVGDDLAHATRLLVTDEAGGIVVDAAYPGWLDDEAAIARAEFAVQASPTPPTWRTDDPAWTQCWWDAGSGEVHSQPCPAPESGATQVGYRPDAEGQIERLTVVACCSEAGEEAIADLLTEYSRRARAEMLLGADPICLHDRALGVVHDQMCRLVAVDQLAATLHVAVGQILLETTD